MVHIFNRLHNNLFNYTTCFDPNGSSSGAFSKYQKNVGITEIVIKKYNTLLQNT
jgi:hypothetical protein